MEKIEEIKDNFKPPAAPATASLRQFRSVFFLHRNQRYNSQIIEEKDTGMIFTVSVRQGYRHLA